MPLVTVINETGIKDLRKRLSKATHDGLKRAGHRVMLSARANARQKDHTQADLAAMDHPYAERHRTLTLTHAGTTLSDDRLAIHRRTGALANSIKGRYVRPERTFTVFFDLSTAPHADYVINGTEIMLGRDLLASTAFGMQAEIEKIMHEAIMPVLES